MGGVNKVILIGFLGKSPEATQVNGQTVAKFSLATSESYRDKVTGERKQITEWHNIVIWGGLADVAVKYLSKGSHVYLEGKLRTSQWEKDGRKYFKTEVIVSNMTMLSRNENQEHKPEPETQSDDLPF